MRMRIEKVEIEMIMDENFLHLKTSPILAHN